MLDGPESLHIGWAAAAAMAIFAGGILRMLMLASEADPPDDPKETPEERTRREQRLYEGMYMEELAEALRAQAQQDEAGDEAKDEDEAGRDDGEEAGQVQQTNAGSARRVRYQAAPPPGACIRELTPCGEIEMRWDAEAEVFVYNTDARNVPYKVLDTAARKFCLDHKCPSICVDYKTEFEKAKVRAIDEREKDRAVALAQGEGQAQGDEAGPFASFKPYNRRATKASRRSSARYRIITERANRFRCAGRLAEEDPAPAARSTQRPSLSFADFKKGMDEGQGIISEEPAQLGLDSGTPSEPPSPGSTNSAP